MRHRRTSTAALAATTMVLGGAFAVVAPPAQAAGACGDPAVPAHDVQGNGATTPIAGAVVTVQAVVVGDFQGAGALGGFFVQEPDDQVDADPNTSEALFVTGSPTDVQVGQDVRVEGTVAEVDGETRLVGAGAALVCQGSPAVTPAARTLPVLGDVAAYWEQTEGMLVTVPQALTATDVEGLDSAGEIGLAAGGRLWAPTEVVAPGPSATARQDANDRVRLLLDDGSTASDPATVPAARVGDTLPSLTAVLDFRGGRFRLQPTGPVAFTHANPRPAAPGPVGGEVRAASLDLGGRPAAAGVLGGLAADVVAAVGVPDGAALAAQGPYAYVGGATGLLYRPSRLTPVGPPATLPAASPVLRPAVAQTFRAPDGGVLTVVAADLASRDADCSAAGDPDTGDGQGGCPDTRTSAATALAGWLAGDPTHSGDADVLLLGDLGAFSREEPVAALRSAGWVDLDERIPAAQRYTAVVDGQSGVLDHGFASPSLAGQVTGVDAWHVSADEPASSRAAAADPLVVGLSLQAPPGVTAGGPYVVAEGGAVALAATGTDPDGDALTYQWDLDGDGGYETAGRTPTYVPSAPAPATRRVSVRVTDPTGLTATASAEVRVVWRFRGFLKPFDQPGVHRVEAGSDVRLRFRMRGFQGRSVLAAGSPTYAAVGCGTGTSLGTPAQDVSARTHLSFRRKTGTYRLRWETSARRRGCGVLTVTLADGTTHQVTVRFVRPGATTKRRHVASQ